MGNMKSLSIGLLGLLGCSSFLYLSGCGKNLDTVVSGGKTNHDVISPGEFLDGDIVLVTGESIQLKELRDQPVVLVFSLPTCISCVAESKEMVQSLEHPEKNPSKIHLITVLAGADQEEALAWKESNQIPWNIAYEEDGKLFRRYCPDFKVPCSYIQLPDKGLILSHTGSLSPQALKKLTGPWE